ncbi:MAG: alpha/beta hydrolase [Acidimicrobiia bacterium]|nr:alpha/beta hydrolase [Acidimicrobiia bacterium]
MSVRSHIRLPAGEFTYLDEGGGPPLVFLHALGRNADDWAPTIEALSYRWRCLALDLRGHGGSVRCERYSFEEMETDVRAFVDALELDRFALVAHSMGANVAWLLAAGTPDRIVRLVIEDTAPPVPGMTFPEPPAVPPEPVDFDWEAAHQIVGQLNDPNPEWMDGPARVLAPTLLIDGSSDDMSLNNVLSKLPDGHFIEITVGHHIHQTAPTEFNAAVETFLSDTEYTI